MEFLIYKRESFPTGPAARSGCETQTGPERRRHGKAEGWSQR